MAAEHAEQDSLGEVQVPDDVYYGAQTQRAAHSFPVSGRGIPAASIHALGLLKAAAAKGNAELGLLPWPGPSPAAPMRWRPARLARQAYEENRTIREIVARDTDLKPQEIDRLLDPVRMTRGGLEAGAAGA